MPIRKRGNWPLEVQGEFPYTLRDTLKIQDGDRTAIELLEQIARQRGHLLKGGQLDLGKTCAALLQDFRKGRLGRLSLD